MMVATHPAISLWQPWASLMAIGAKGVETRSWPPAQKYIGQTFAIASTASTPTITKLVHDMGEDTVYEIENILRVPHRRWIKDLPHGSVLCLAKLEGAYLSLGHKHTEEYVSLGMCMPGSRPLGGMHMGYPGILFGNHQKSRWLWSFRLTERLEKPFRCTGRQGIWQWTRPVRPSLEVV